MRSNIAHFSIILIVALLMAACGSEQPSDISPESQATIEALAAEVENLQAQVALLQTDAGGADDASLIAQVASGQVELNAETGAEKQADEEQPSSPIAVEEPVIEEPVIEEPVIEEPTNTPTPPPPPTPLPTFAPTPLDGAPPADRYRPDGRIGEFWAADHDRQQSLGWALEEELHSVDTVVQNFEHGLMLWRSDTGQIFALWNDDDQRHWRAVEDTFEEGEMEKDPAISPPGGLRQPERGFGKAWRVYPDLREGLGWALEREQKTNARVQAFERGLVTELGLSTYAIGQTPEGETIWDMK